MMLLLSSSMSTSARVVKEVVSIMVLEEEAEVEATDDSATLLAIEEAVDATDGAASLVVVAAVASMLTALP